MDKLKNIKNKSGYTSIEAVLMISVFLIIFMLSISLFGYMYPQIQIQNEVMTLSKICERQGGLTNQDIETFTTKLDKYGYMLNNELPIIVTAISESGDDVSNITPLGDIGSDYVTRDGKEIINVRAEIPANNELLKNVTTLFGISGLMDYYYFNISVLSERY